MNLGAPELLILLAVVLLLFGGRKLPELARSIGHAKREFEQGVDDASTPSSNTSKPT
jgi:sec-independent protein translocase protein TatA